MTPNSISGIMLVFALSLPGSAQLSPRVVDQIQFPKTADLSGQSWTDSFSFLENIMSREYPFTRWRRIDWSQRYSAYSTRIEEAERRNAVDDYRLALREYIYSFPTVM